MKPKVGFIFKLVGKMFTIKLLKLECSHESLPTAWGLINIASKLIIKLTFKVTMVGQTKQSWFNWLICSVTIGR